MQKSSFSNAKFLVFDTKSLVCNPKCIMFTDQANDLRLFLVDDDRQCRTRVRSEATSVDTIGAPQLHSSKGL